MSRYDLQPLGAHGYEQDELPRPRWRWAAGMRDTDPESAALVVTVGPRGIPVRWVVFGEPDGDRYALNEDEALTWWHDAVPALDDPATAGVIVGMLREAVPGWTVEILMLRAHVEVCVGSPGSGGRTVHVDTSLGRAAARAWLGVTRG